MERAAMLPSRSMRRNTAMLEAHVHDREDATSARIKESATERIEPQFRH